MLQVWIGNRGMCQQLLEVPGVELPLMMLHWAADWMQ